VLAAHAEETDAARSECQTGGSDGLSVFFPQDNKNVISPKAAKTAATVNPAVEISARE